jgi:hypothetical protein
LPRRVGIIVRREDFPLSPREFGSPEDMQNFASGEAKFCIGFLSLKRPASLT